MPTYTPNLKLPQWTANEHPGYMSDFNQAFLSIDNGIGGITQNVDQAVATAARAETVAEQAENIGQENSARIVAVENEIARVELLQGVVTAEPHFTLANVRAYEHLGVLSINIGVYVDSSDNITNAMPVATVRIPGYVFNQSELYTVNSCVDESEKIAVRVPLNMRQDGTIVTSNNQRYVDYFKALFQNTIDAYGVYFAGTFILTQSNTRSNPEKNTYYRIDKQ